MDALITELEAAPVGSRELSDKVLLATGWSIGSTGHWFTPEHERLGINPQRPSPTESLDAALTLVPEGWFINTANQSNSGWIWGLYNPDIQECVANRIEKEPPALALTIAALKARP